MYLLIPFSITICVSVKTTADNAMLKHLIHKKLLANQQIQKSNGSTAHFSHSVIAAVQILR
ncbi:hypothetical protein JCM19240_404 [Vibrio maritimus]|uniref:Uncharacterized protein n=1 Tax=Vibrio maritimus TaxID=990268 RepID=A0A090TXG6_9VIBR|nr:hypothetical protein JCM19240_404 [Vibrio maritimus]